MDVDPRTASLLLKHIQRHWSRGCPMCGHFQWQSLGWTFVQVSATGTVAWGVQGVPALALACSQCGFVATVTATAVGLQ